MPRPRQPCGTFAAYQRHLANREVPCLACADASRDRYLAPMRRAILAEAVYTGKPVRGMQGARQRAILRGEL